MENNIPRSLIEKQFNLNKDQFINKLVCKVGIFQFFSTN